MMKLIAIRPLVFAVFLLPLLVGAGAEVRVWTSADDPSRQFKGEFKGITDNQVTIQMADGRGLAKVDLAKLSKADQQYILNARDPGKPATPQPVDADKEPFDPERHPSTMILDFVFGESPDEVYVRLKKHGAAKGGVNEILRGRTGLNDHFYVQIGEVRYGLFFEFGDDGLEEVSLQSQGFSPEKFNTSLRDTWMEVRDGITKNYGKALLDGKFPNKSELPAGSAISTDIWASDSGKQIFLGLGFQDGNYSCLVRSANRPFVP